MSKELNKLAAQRGLTVLDRGYGHYQLSGGPLLVNYYPESKNKSAYVAGTVKAKKHVSVEQAIDMCFEQPKNLGKKDKRRRDYKKIKARLYKKNPACLWCPVPLFLNRASLEHIIPLDKGGLDNINNMGLAHIDCNNDRGSKMPELKAFNKQGENNVNTY